MNCPRCGARDCNDPDSKACSDNCITRLQRELAAYQNAEMPEANHAELVKHMREESFDCPLCAQAADYLDALAKHCARQAVELDAAQKDAERLKHLHDDPKRAQAYFWNHQGRKKRNAAIDTALSAGKEKAE